MHESIRGSRLEIVEGSCVLVERGVCLCATVW